ncbi:hypothetical protein ACFQZS_01090 [Mucilaginibacter calamicampi]|uniref:Uncharacterized protein n=1 Tax=Mucilaginibacter calamicampi TaxID=1302352 RepID=A0ABW2YRJ7_9SPHI
MLKTLFFSSIVMWSVTVNAQSPTDTAVTKSPIRTLTRQQYDAYLKGNAGNEMAAAGELNHYPMPDKVLNLSNQLDLSAVQIKKITEISTLMHRRRLQIGGSIISNEKMLDSLFKYRKVSEGNLIFYTNRHGLYQGELKNAVLQACLATEKLLSQQQIAKLETLQKK